MKVQKLDIVTGYCLLFGSLFSFLGLVLIISKFRIKNLISSDKSYVAAHRSVSCTYITFSNFSAAMGSWILFLPPELGALYGCLAVLFYTLATIIPMWIVAIISKHFRKIVINNGFSFSDYAKTRYGKIMEIFVQLSSLFSMWMTLAGELIFISFVFYYLTEDVSRAAVIISHSLITLFYTFYGGLLGSLVTDIFQGILILTLTIIAAATFLKNTQINADSWNEAASFSQEGLQSGLIMVFSYLPAYILDQGVWQRALAGKTNKSVAFGFLFGSLLIIPCMLLYGFSGILARAMSGSHFSELESASLSFFLLLSRLDKALIGCILFMSVCLAASTIDTMQSAIPSLVASYLNSKGKSFLYAKLFAFLVNVPAVLLALLWNDDALILFLMSNVVSACIAPPLLLGFFLRQCDETACVVGCTGGLISVFLFGAFWTKSFVGGLLWYTLPEGINTVATLWTFIFIQLSSAFFTLTVSLYNAFKRKKLIDSIQKEFFSTSYDAENEHKVKIKETSSFVPKYDTNTLNSTHEVVIKTELQQ